MGTKKGFQTLEKGDNFSFCAEGGFTVTKVYKNNGVTVKISAKSDGGVELTLTPEDDGLINM